MVIGAVGLGDGERVARRDQEVVQQQPRQHRRQRRGCDTAEQGDDEHADEEQRTLTADTEERVEQKDDEGADCGRNHKRSKPRRQVTLAW